MIWFCVLVLALLAVTVLFSGFVFWEVNKARRASEKRKRELRSFLDTEDSLWNGYLDSGSPESLLTWAQYWEEKSPIGPLANQSTITWIAAKMKDAEDRGEPLLP